MGLSREAFFQAGAAAFKTETVEVTELGGSVTCRELNTAHRMRVVELAKAMDKETTGNAGRDFFIELVMTGCIDDDAAPLFTRSDRDALAAMPSGVIDRIAKVVLRLSGLSAEALDTAKKD